MRVNPFLFFHIAIFGLWHGLSKGKSQSLKRRGRLRVMSCQARTAKAKLIHTTHDDIHRRGSQQASQRRIRFNSQALRQPA
jgi:hypothetical protein